MSVTLRNIDEICLDALKEVGNIGAGNAMTALANMLDRTVDMSTPRVGIVPLSEFTQMVGGPEMLAAGVYMPVEGDAPGHVAFLLSEESACRLADQLLGREIGETTSLGEMEKSVLMEVGNILTGSYLVAIGEMTGLNLLLTPPAIAVDMTAAILSEIASVYSTMDDCALTIVTTILESYGTLEGYFIYIPEPGSLEITLRALQLDV